MRPTSTMMYASFICAWEMPETGLGWIASGCPVRYAEPVIPVVWWVW